MSLAHESGDLKWLLDDLLKRVPDVNEAIVFSQDGLLMAASGQAGGEDPDQLAAMASGYQSLSQAAGRRFGGGHVRQTIVEMESAFLFIIAAGQRACLAAISSPESDIGLVAYEMSLLVQQVGEALSTPARRGAPQGTWTA